MNVQVKLVSVNDDWVTVKLVRDDGMVKISLLKRNGL